MNQIFTTLAQVATWCMSTPATQRFTMQMLLALSKGYRQLSPATKAKVDLIMIRAAGMLVKAALGDVVDWAGAEAVSLGLNADATAVAKAGVRRVAEVGIDKALEEMRNS